MHSFQSNLHRPLPSSYQLHRRSERERSLVMNALLRSATGRLVNSVIDLGRGGLRLAREFIKKRRQRREIRALLGLDDRALADMGLGRSEIERAVRTGRDLADEVSLRRDNTLRAVAPGSARRLSQGVNPTSTQVLQG